VTDHDQRLLLRPAQPICEIVLDHFASQLTETMPMNPVVFEAWQTQQGFVPFCDRLSEFDWENHLVGLTDSGFLYVNDRVSRTGYYDFFPKLLPWEEAHHVRIAGIFGVKGFLGGMLLSLVGICGTVGLIKGNLDPVERSKAIKLAVAGCCGGPIFIFGARRNRIRVKSKSSTFTWTSGPLGYRKTLPICRLTAAYCVANDIEHVPHPSATPASSGAHGDQEDLGSI
jgi:hypothetical protein